MHLNSYITKSSMFGNKAKILYISFQFECLLSCVWKCIFFVHDAKFLNCVSVYIHIIIVAKALT